MLTSAAMLAPDGRCKTLDAAADGYVRGEACVTLGLSARELSGGRDGGRDLGSGGGPAYAAVLAGSAVNQDGRSSSLTAPNGPSQQAVVRLALGDASLAPADVATLEMHGTGGRCRVQRRRHSPLFCLSRCRGFALIALPPACIPAGTALGDPIEVGAALAVFNAKRGLLPAPPLELSAAKSSLGHAEPAAGAAGLLRALHRLHSGSAVGILHLSAANPHIAGSLEQQRAASPAAMLWMPRGPSCSGVEGAVGVSGFAFQGTNAHVVLARCATPCRCCGDRMGCCDRVTAGAAIWSRSSQRHPRSRRPRKLAPTAPSSKAGAATGVWDRRRHWFAPPAHRKLARHTAAGSGTSRFECRLDHPQHAYLWQHAASTRPLLPGAAMFEAAAAAAGALLPEEQHLQRGPAGLCGAAIAAPLLLKTPGSVTWLLVVSVQRQTGSVELRSRQAGPGRHAKPTAHLSASTACVPAAQLQRGRSGAWSAAQTDHGWLRQLCQRASWTGDAGGSICCQPLTETGADGYGCHPAVADASTHFGAAFDLQQGGASRVPVSLGCYLPLAQRASPSIRCIGSTQLCTAASPGRLLTDGSRVSSFSVHGALTLGRLQSRAIGSKQPAAQNGVAALAAVLAERCCTYATVWQASVSLPAASQPPPRALLQLHAGRQTASVQPAATSSLLHAAMQCYAATLRMLHTLPSGQTQVLTATATSAAAQYGPPRAAAARCSRGSLAGAGAGVVAGLLRVAALEEPDWQLQARFMDSAAASGSAPDGGWPADAYGAAATGSAGFVPRMQLAAAQPAADGASQPLASSGCHVISGGMGGLGALVGSHIVLESQGGSRLLLLGRSGRFAGSSSVSGSQQQRALRNGPGSLTLVQTDVAAASDAAAVARQLMQCGTHAASFIHTAGVLADGLLHNQRLPAARSVLAPKLAGLAAALAHLQHQALQQLILFSSISAALGNAGQANYAAANAALDTAAVALAATGCTACSLQWGAWGGSGMAVQTPQLLARLQKQGLGAVHPGQGLAVLADCLHRLCQAAPVLAASPLHWRELLYQQPCPVFSDFEALAGAAAWNDPGATSAIKRMRTTAPAGDRSAQVAPRVLAIVAEVLGAAVEANCSLMEVRALPALAPAALPSRAAMRLQHPLPSAYSCRLTPPCRPAWTRWAPWSCATHWAQPSRWTCPLPPPLTTPPRPPWRRSSAVGCLLTSRTCQEPPLLNWTSSALPAAFGGAGACTARVPHRLHSGV